MKLVIIQLNLSTLKLLPFKGALNFYTNSMKNLHINPKLFYDLLHGNTTWI